MNFVITNVTITPNSNTKFKNALLVPGDVNKDGIIDLEDVNAVKNNYGNINGMTLYDINCDFNEDESIELEDINTVKNNYGLTLMISKQIVEMEEFKDGEI